MDNYGEPDEYLPDLNAAIQASRNATFALQKAKKALPDFDAWYKPWQDSFAADPIMAWMNEARVKIVHVGDIEAQSRTRVRLIGDYYGAGEEFMDELLELDMSIEPDNVGASRRRSTRSIAAILAALREKGHPEQLLNEMTVSIERRWEEDSLPGRELQAAVAHAYAVVANLLNAAHLQVSAKCVHTYGCDEGMPSSDIGRAPRVARCMSTTRDQRTIVVEATTGALLESGEIWGFDQRPFERNLGEDPSRYIAQLDRERLQLDQRPVTVLDLLPRYVEYAKAILRTGDEHGWFVFFYRGTTPIDRAALAAADPAQKRGLAVSIARRALELDATGVVEIGEAWQSPEPDSPHDFIRPAQHPDRVEVLVLSAETSSGLSRQAVVPLDRPEGVGGPISFGETNFAEEGTNNFLLPLREAWALQRQRVPAPRGASFFRPDRI